MRLLIGYMIVLAPGIFFVSWWTEQVKSDRKENARRMESGLPRTNNSTPLGCLAIAYLVSAVIFIWFSEGMRHAGF